MSESKHTPGPWSNPTGSVSVFAQRDGERVKVGDIHGSIRDGAEQSANARLMARSPDMLDAFRGVLDAAQIEADDLDLALFALSDIRRIAEVETAKATD